MLKVVGTTPTTEKVLAFGEAYVVKHQQNNNNDIIKII